MKASLVLALVGACTQPARAVVQFPFAKQGIPIRDDTKRGSKPRALDSDFFLGAMTYVVNATVGSPGQPVSLVLSPSSSDTWVVDARSDDCISYNTTYGEPDENGYYDSDNYHTEIINVCVWGSFATNTSSTYKSESPDNDGESSSYYSYYDFENNYSDGTYAYGDYFNDSIALGDVSFDNFTLGLVNTTNRIIGTLGLGYNDTTRSTFTDRLVAEGLINSTTYSIWVDDAQASSGNILFGAVDTTKFEGSLSRVSSYYSGSQMIMTIASINATTKDSGGPISITYDEDSYYSSSSSSDYMFQATYSPPDVLSVLPDSVASQIWEVAGAYYDEDVSMALIGCNAGNNDASTLLSFRLGRGPNGPNISVALEDLIVPVSDVDLSSYSSSYFYNLDTEVCLFGVQNRSISSYSYSYTYSDYSLGSSILRRTYSVFDFVNDEIAIAPIKFGATETSNVVPFATYGSTAPMSTMRCVYSSCYETTASDGTTSDDDDDDERGLASDILSWPALLGLSLGLGLGSLALGVVGFLIWRHRRNKRLAAAKDAGGSVSSAEAGRSAPVPPAQGVTAAGGAAPGPEMTQASHQQPPPRTPRGKAPEIPMPENLASAEERPEASTSAQPEGRHAHKEHAPVSMLNTLP